MRDNYTLEQAMAAFLRTNCYFFMVVNSNGTLVGLLTFKMLISHLLGKAPEDDFEADGDVNAVAKR
jgi:CBS domain containing-hemolysin-like protein